MNRETKRMMQRRPAEAETPAWDDAPAGFVPERTRATQPQGLSLPGRVVEFGRDVRSELRQVAWPTRQEVANSATVVLLVLVLLVGLIFLLNYAFSHGVLDLLNV